MLVASSPRVCGSGGGWTIGHKWPVPGLDGLAGWWETQHGQAGVTPYGRELDRCKGTRTRCAVSGSAGSETPPTPTFKNMHGIGPRTTTFLLIRNEGGGGNPIVISSTFRPVRLLFFVFSCSTCCAASRCCSQGGVVCNYIPLAGTTRPSARALRLPRISAPRS